MLTQSADKAAHQSKDCQKETFGSTPQTGAKLAEKKEEQEDDEEDGEAFDEEEEDDDEKLFDEDIQKMDEPFRAGQDQSDS